MRDRHRERERVRELKYLNMFLKVCITFGLDLVYPVT